MNRSALLWVAVTAAVLIPARTATPQSGAQSAEIWPDRAENLQVLPEDFPPERLRAVMTGFTRALGVRCTHCHAGEEGTPLAELDFASDANATKQTARLMLEMLGTINEDYLERLQPSGPGRVNMWCHTCHRGQPRPMTLGENLSEVYAESGADGAVARYEELRERFFGRGSFDFEDEGVLNALGYAALEEGKHDDAIALFRLNAEQYPESANAWDSLAEAYLEAGKNETAVVYYQKSLGLDPGNENAAAMLKKLRAEPPSGR